MAKIKKEQRVGGINTTIVSFAFEFANTYRTIKSLLRVKGFGNFHTCMKFLLFTTNACQNQLVCSMV